MTIFAASVCLLMLNISKNLHEFILFIRMVWFFLGLMLIYYIRVNKK